ncbi:MAG TPA: hypothetical protein DCY53_10185 [Desulfobacteraceae bacterium]|nr:hypothetical protein [Desulfobacteraceae bacterium]
MEIDTKCTKKPERLYFGPSIRSNQANSSLFVKTKLKISVPQGNGVFFHVELQQRVQTPQLVEAKRRSLFIGAAGFSSAYKINRIPYSRRFPAACCRELQ